MAQTEAQKRYYKTPKGIAAKKRGDAKHYAKNGDVIRTHVLDQFHALTPEEKLDLGRRRRLARDPEVVKREKRDEQARVKLDVIQGYGGECACCKNDHLPHLTIDHIEGGGSEHRRRENQRSFYRRLRREGFPPGYRVLCFNCNFAAHLNGGECDCGLTVTRPKAVLREVI